MQNHPYGYPHLNPKDAKEAQDFWSQRNPEGYGQEALEALQEGALKIFKYGFLESIHIKEGLRFSAYILYCADTVAAWYKAQGVGLILPTPLVDLREAYNKVAHREEFSRRARSAEDLTLKGVGGYRRTPSWMTSP